MSAEKGNQEARKKENIKKLLHNAMLLVILSGDSERSARNFQKISKTNEERQEFPSSK